MEVGEEHWKTEARVVVAELITREATPCAEVSGIETRVDGGICPRAVLRVEVDGRKSLPVVGRFSASEHRLQMEQLFYQHFPHRFSVLLVRVRVASHT